MQTPATLIMPTLPLFQQMQSAWHLPSAYAALKKACDTTHGLGIPLSNKTHPSWATYPRAERVPWLGSSRSAPYWAPSYAHCVALAILFPFLGLSGPDGPCTEESGPIQLRASQSLGSSQQNI